MTPELVALINSALHFLDTFTKEELEDAIEQAKNSGGDTSAIERLLAKT